MQPISSMVPALPKVLLLFPALLALLVLTCREVWYTNIVCMLGSLMVSWMCSAIGGVCMCVCMRACVNVCACECVQQWHSLLCGVSTTGIASFAGLNSSQYICRSSSPHPVSDWDASSCACLGSCTMIAGWHHSHGWQIHTSANSLVREPAVCNAVACQLVVELPLCHWPLLVC